MAFKCQLNVLLSYGGQARDQEATVQRTFTLREAAFNTTCNRNTDPCPPEVRPRPMKTKRNLGMQLCTVIGWVHPV